MNLTVLPRIRVRCFDVLHTLCGRIGDAGFVFVGGFQTLQRDILFLQGNLNGSRDQAPGCRMFRKQVLMLHVVAMHIAKS